METCARDAWRIRQSGGGCGWRWRRFGGGGDSGTGRVENQNEWWALRWQLWAGGGGGGGGGGGFGYNDSIVVLQWQYHRRTMVVQWSYNNGRIMVVQ